MRSALSDWGDRVRRSVRTTVNQGKSASSNQATQAQQESEDLVGKASLDFINHLDAIRQKIDDANEKSKFDWGNAHAVATSLQKELGSLGGDRRVLGAGFMQYACLKLPASIFRMTRSDVATILGSIIHIGWFRDCDYLNLFCSIVNLKEACDVDGKGTGRG